MTTIKVEMTLRDRLNRIAKDEGVTVSRAIEGLVAERERAERFRRLRDDMAAMSDEERNDYARELEAWDSTLADGLSSGARATD